jgi:hypothetical protein
MMAAKVTTPQTARAGECAYCLAAVTNAHARKRKHCQPAPLVCRRCEARLIAGAQPPVAVKCPDCDGAGDVECECDCPHCNHREPCGKCNGRGMRVVLVSDRAETQQRAEHRR